MVSIEYKNIHRVCVLWYVTSYFSSQHWAIILGRNMCIYYESLYHYIQYVS